VKISRLFLDSRTWLFKALGFVIFALWLARLAPVAPAPVVSDRLWFELVSSQALPVWFTVVLHLIILSTAVGLLGYLLHRSLLGHWVSYIPFAIVILLPPAVALAIPPFGFLGIVLTLLYLFLLLEKPASQHYEERLAGLGVLVGALALALPTTVAIGIALSLLLPLAFKFKRFLARLWWYVGAVVLVRLLIASWRFLYETPLGTGDTYCTLSGAYQLPLVVYILLFLVPVVLFIVPKSTKSFFSNRALLYSTPLLFVLLSRVGTLFECPLALGRLDLLEYGALFTLVIGLFAWLLGKRTVRW
jgi:hypothetical protein